MADITKFSERVNRARVRAETVRQATPPGDALGHELQMAFEELLVAEEELRQQNDELAVAAETIDRERARYLDLFEFAPDGYVVTDTLGIIREANRAVREMFGAAAKALIGKPLIVFVAPEHRRRFRALLMQMPQLRRLADWEILMRRRQAPSWPAAVTAVVEPTGELRWLLRDVTDRRRQQDELQARTDELEARVHARTADLERRTVDLANALRSEQEQRRRAEESDRAKEAFLATVSHELRTPLTALLGWVYLLTRGSQDESGDRRALGAIERSARAGQAGGRHPRRHAHDGGETEARKGASRPGRYRGRRGGGAPAAGRAEEAGDLL